MNVERHNKESRRMDISKDVIYIIPPLVFASFKRQSITEVELSLTGNTLPSSSICWILELVENAEYEYDF